MKVAPARLALALALTAPVGAQITYGFNGDGHLYSVDFESGTATYLWGTPLGWGAFGIAQAPDPAALYVTDHSDGGLYEIWPAQQAVALVGTLSPQLNTLTRNEDDGQYYGSTWSELYHLEPANMDATHIAPLWMNQAFGFDYHRGLGEILIADSADDQLHRFDLDTGFATPIGPHGQTQVTGIWYHEASGRTFGVCDVNDNGALIEFDVATGQATVIAYTGINFVSLGGEPEQVTVGTAYCAPANMNSTGASGLLEAMGSADIGLDNMQLEASALPPGEFSFFITGQVQGFVTPPGSQGNLCLASPIGRFRQDIFFTGPLGQVSYAPDLANHPIGAGVAVQPGDTWHYQLWFRDQNPHPTSNFTNGVSVVFH